jgi:uncharacterized protein (TIGR03067 family)
LKTISIILILFAGLSGLATCEENKVTKNPLKGKWQLINKNLERIGAALIWEITDTDVTIRDVNTGEIINRFKYITDTTKTPNWITMEVDDSPTGNSGDRRLGIFQIQGDDLQIKQEYTDGGDRPTKFDGHIVSLRRSDAKKEAEQD